MAVEVLNTSSALSAKTLATLEEFAASGGSALSGFLQAGTGAVARTAQAVLRETIRVTDFGTVGNGSTDDYAAIDAARVYATSLSTGANLLFPRGTYKLSTSITFDADLALIFERGGQVSPDTTKTVTILGPLLALSAQIFTGAGTIVFTGNRSLHEMFPEWWGAVGDDSTDNATAFTSAYTAAKTCGADLRLAANATYRFATGLTWNGQVNVYGSANTILKKVGNIVGITITPTDPAEYADFRLSATGTDSSDGMRVNTSGAAGFRARNLYITGHGGHGLVVLGAANNYFENISTVSNTGDGLRLAPTGTDFVNANVFNGIDTRSNGGYGVNVNGGGLGTDANQFYGVVSQNNTSYGYRDNGKRNLFVGYTETNTAGNVLLDTSRISPMVVLLNSTVDPAIVDNGADNTPCVLDVSNVRFAIPNLRPVRPTTNIAGRNTSFQGGQAGAGATGRVGGEAVLEGGAAAGTTGAAAGGRVYVQGGTGINTGAIGLFEKQPNGGKEVRSAALTVWASLDATPSVADNTRFRTANAGATTITDFDDTSDGQQFIVHVNDANTTIDFSATNLKGNAGVDYAAPLNTVLVVDVVGSLKYCQIVKPS